MKSNTNKDVWTYTPDIEEAVVSSKKKVKKIFRGKTGDSTDSTLFWIYFIMSGAASYFWYLTVFILRGVTPHPALFGFGIFLARTIIAYVGQNKIWVDPTTTIFLYPFSLLTTKKNTLKSCTIWTRAIFLCILQLFMGVLAAATSWGLKIPFAGAPSLNLNYDIYLGLLVEILTTLFLFTFLIHLMDQFKKVMSKEITSSEKITVKPKLENPEKTLTIKVMLSEPYKQEIILFMNSFAQGCVYSLLYMLAFQFTGGALDFWQYIWPAAITGSINSDIWWIYLVGPYVGAFLAVLLNYGPRRYREMKKANNGQKVKTEDGRGGEDKSEEDFNQEVFSNACCNPEDTDDD
jgi:hypothetical protein